MGKFKTSWSLFRSSLSVIRKNKKLLLFPIIGFIFLIIIGLFFLSPVFLWDSGHSITELSHWETLGQHIHNIFENKEISDGTKIEKLFGDYWYAWFVSFYLISMFSSTFLNVAFYNEIINGLNGKRVYLLSVANRVYRGALYVYASEGVIPGYFDEDMMNRAWKVKKVKNR